jgi:hypothetical protein
MTEIATAHARVLTLLAEARAEYDAFEKDVPEKGWPASGEKSRLWGRVSILTGLSDIAMLKDWSANPQWQAQYIHEHDDDPLFYARLVLEICPLKCVLDLAKWDAPENLEIDWLPEDNPGIRRAMAQVMTSHAHLLTPRAAPVPRRSRGG